MKPDEAMKGVFKLHGHESPGTAVGAFMTEYAAELLGKLYGIDIKNDETAKNIYAAAETDVCLPDSIQVMTHCTIGNGKLRVLGWGKFALTLYYYNKHEGGDKNNGKGVRVRIITGEEKQKKYRDFYDWFLKRKSKHELPKERVIEDIKRAKREILDYQEVRVKGSGSVKFAIMFCEKCGEPCPKADNGLCRGCISQKYYTTK